MRGRAPRFIPVVIEFPEGEARVESWGRFLDLAPAGARLMTRTPLRRGEALLLTFDLPGERFERARAGVVSSAKDEDGYYVCRMKFSAADDRVRMGRILREALR